MYVHTRERDRRPGFNGVKIKFYYYFHSIFTRCDTPSHENHLSQSSARAAAGGQRNSAHLRATRNRGTSFDDRLRLGLYACERSVDFMLK